MLSDDLGHVVERLRLAQELDEPMTPENCRLLANVLDCCVEEARGYERTLHIPPYEPAWPPNVLPFPRAFRCVTRDGGAA